MTRKGTCPSADRSTAVVGEMIGTTTIGTAMEVISMGEMIGTAVEMVDAPMEAGGTTDDQSQVGKMSP